jgi:hypothetical protein
VRRRVQVLTHLDVIGERQESCRMIRCQAEASCSFGLIAIASRSG